MSSLLIAGCVPSGGLPNGFPHQFDSKPFAQLSVLSAAVYLICENFLRQYAKTMNIIDNRFFQ